MSKRKEAFEEGLKRLSARERTEAIREAQEQKKWKRYGIIGCIVAVLVAALLFWDNGFIQRRATALTVGSKNYTVADVDYYYHSQYNNMYSYASYYGLDTDKSLKDQEIYSGTTWYDYLRDSAESSLKEVSILAQEGEAAGYTLSEDGQKELDDTLQELADNASENNVSESYYLRRMFGRFMTKKIYTKLVTEQIYASDYSDYKKDSIEVSEDDMNTYYDENKDTLDTYDYEAYKIDAEPETQYDDNGDAIEATDEETAAALDSAESLAAEVNTALKTDNENKISEWVTNGDLEDYSDTEPSAFSNYEFGTWLTDASRKAGDTTVVTITEEQEVESDTADTDTADSSADASTDPADKGSSVSSADGSTSAAGENNTVTVITGFYVVKFNNRYRDDYHAANILSVLVDADTEESDDEDAEVVYLYDDAKAKADALLAKWQANGGDEDAFKALTATDEDEEDESDEDTADEDTSADSSAAEEIEETYTADDYTSVKKGSMSADINDWLYGDTTRQPGECAVLFDEDNHGYRLVYFQSYDELYYWQTVAKSAIQSEQYSDWYDEAAENYDTKETWFYSQVA